MADRSSLHIYERNKLEDLLKIFSIILQNRKFDPLKKEKVIIQSQGMSTWISRQLSEQLGIFANIDFVFPNAFIDELFKKCFKDSYDPDRLSRDVLAFRIMKVLSENIEDNKRKYPQIYNYIDQYTSRNFKISSKLSALYDDYQIFRYEMINRWSSDSNKDDWQAELYREIKPKNVPDRSQLLYRLQKLNITKERIKEIIGADTIYIFGVSVLPPYYLKIFEFLSQFIDIHMLLMNPCREFWLDIKTEREKAHKFICAAQKSGIENLEEEDLHFFTGNTLLAEFGGMGREFFSQLLDTNSIVEVSQTKNALNPQTLLEHIQEQITELHQVEEGSEKIKIRKDDNSIQINSCHGKRREIEVLKDNILNILEKNPDIQPSDIIVMAPNIQDYYQLVDGIFSKSYSGERIPFSISDLSLRQENHLIDLFLKLIAQTENEIKASEFLELIEDPIIMETFNISENDLPIVRNWIKETNMRSSVVNDDLYTIKHGLDQLLSGFLMNQEIVIDNRITPYVDVEGNLAILLGNIIELAAFLSDLMIQSKDKKTLKDWGIFLLHVLQRFDNTDISYNQHKLIRDTIDVFTREENNIQTLSGFDEEIDFNTMRIYLERQLGTSLSSKGFLSCGITFSSMLPMRSIPFKVICLLGMDQDTFPRKDPKLEFDLIKKNPKIGDRSTRKSDLYLFLEALMSSRKYLYISYIGQDSKDNSERNPSVVVEQLLEYIDSNFFIKDKEISEHIIKSHRLQSFHSDYFKKDSELFSYNLENFEVSKAYTENTKEEIVIESKINVSDEEKVYSPQDIVLFFKAPCEFYLKNEKELVFLNQEDELKDYEEYKADGLTRYFIVRTIFELLSRGKDKVEIYSLLKNRGMLPVENFGKMEFDKQFQKAHLLFTKIKDKKSRTVEIKYLTDNINIEGNLTSYDGKEHIKILFSKFKGKYMMEAMLEHLMLSYASEGHKETVIYYIENDDDIKDIRIKNTEKSYEYLKNLIDIFKTGICKNIPLFNECVFDYYQEYKKKKIHDEKPLKKAINAFYGGFKKASVLEDIYNDFFYKDIDITRDQDFASYCKTISEIFCEMEVEDDE